MPTLTDPPSIDPHRHDACVLIIGGGGTGAALAHDLTLRGLRVTVVERGELTAGTTVDLTLYGSRLAEG